MKKEEIFKTVEEILIVILENKSIKIDYNSSSENIAEWTSMRHVLILNEIEKKFEVSFEIDDIIELVSVKDIVEKLVQLKNENN